MPHRLTTLLLTLSCLLAISTSAIVPAAQAAPPDPRVDARAWADITTAGEADVLILLTGQPDLSPAYRLPTKEARGRWVYDALRVHAQRSQSSLVAELERR